MAATATKSNGRTTLTLTFSAPSAGADPIIENWAKFCWYDGFGLTDADGNLLDFDLATTQQKLDAIGRSTKTRAIQEANSQEVTDDLATLSPTQYTDIDLEDTV